VVGFFLGITVALAALTWLLTCVPPENSLENKVDGINVSHLGRVAVENGKDVQKGISQGPSLPHAVTIHGCFHGLVYTVVESAWNARECVLDWPPSLKIFKSWNAQIDQGTLVLKPLDDSKGETLGIPLAQCRIDIVRDGLKGRSDFLRRSPLLISHDHHAIMDGERGFYLFANSPASKMCWVSALRFWSADDASEHRYVQEQYREYCREMTSSSDTRLRRDMTPQGRRSWRNLGMRSFRALGREENETKLKSLESLIDREWMGSPEKKEKCTSRSLPEKTNDQEASQRNREESRPSTPWQRDLPSLCNPEMFFNDLLLRCSFDFMRNPHFAEGIASRIQLQLDRIHKPDYVQSLDVIQVDAGSTCPRISNLYSLPSPFPDTKMPQIVFDMKYEGSFSITIELKVDIRDSKGWGTLDKALDMIEGRPKALCEGSEEIDLLRTISGMHEEEIVAEKDNRPNLTNLNSLRQGAAQRLRKFADSTASRIASIPIRVKLTFSALEGPMCAWVMPPPGDRLFWSFLKSPKVSISAKPAFGERVFKYAYHASRASAWIEARMRLSFKKNLVFPSGGDFQIPGMFGVDHPSMPDTQMVPKEEESMQERDEEIMHDDLSSKPSSSRPFFEMRFRV